jgi:membrane protease YdiL (CAAX protease family)
VPEAAAQCPACHRNVRPDTQFCPGCGQTLADSAAPAPGDAARSDAAAASRARFAKHWDELKRVGWIFGLLLLTSFVFGTAWRRDPSPWWDVAMTTADAAIVLVAVAQRYGKLRFLFQLRPSQRRDSLAMVAMAFLFVGLASAYFWGLERLGVPLASMTEPFLRAGWPVWSMFLLISVTPAIFEELAFRGVIQSALERILNARDAWLIQAALFSVLHLSPLIFPSHFLMGLCLGYMRRRSRSIYPGMLLHASWNALVVFQEFGDLGNLGFDID